MKCLATVGRAGFTLVELVSVIAIVAILVSLALPSYRGYLLRVNRTQAVAALIDLASCQERVFAMTGRYNTARCIPEQLDRYAVRIEPADSTQSLSYTAWAEPTGSQIADPCGSLGIDHTGLRLTTGNDSQTNKCWNGR